MSRHTLAFGLATLLVAPIAHAQLTIDWYTIDGGGGTSTGGGFTISGTIGQPDAGRGVGGALECVGGFWSAQAGTCYANCDGSTVVPVLNVNDFSCFLNRFAAGDTRANCDGSTVAPVLNVNDFSCFLNQYAIGCP
ncbi:MAG: hypothetical protein JNM80_15425 [Phycisphaerae bacterium]|nr:hypothetical protein [Phycisphaerae bacterium]